MNSTVFAVAVVSAVAGAIFGVLVKHILDTRLFNEVCRWYADEATKVDERDKVIKDLQDEINRLHTALAVKSLRQVTQVKPSSDMQVFYDLVNKPLPEGFDDIDFGGKF